MVQSVASMTVQQLAILTSICSTAVAQSAMSHTRLPELSRELWQTLSISKWCRVVTQPVSGSLVLTVNLPSHLLLQTSNAIIYTQRHIINSLHPYSFLVSTNIYNAQLSRMSHCAPVARKPKSWVHAWSCCRWYPRHVSVLEGYSRHEAPRQRNFCHRMCCMCVEQHTICR